MEFLDFWHVGSAICALSRDAGQILPAGLFLGCAGGFEIQGSLEILLEYVPEYIDEHVAGTVHAVLIVIYRPHTPPCQEFQQQVGQGFHGQGRDSAADDEIDPGLGQEIFKVILPACQAQGISHIFLRGSPAIQAGCDFEFSDMALIDQMIHTVDHAL